MAFASSNAVDHGSPDKPAVEVLGWGCSQYSSEQMIELRRFLPQWAPPGTPGHFLKYADEQTLVAIQAVDDAIQKFELDPVECQDWGVIAAPQFLGRQVTAQAVELYARQGGQRISPHIVPQNSLHSVSGALSILLGSHGLNVGMGGGPDALTDGLLAALTLVGAQPSRRTWLVATGWDPEPLPDRLGQSCTAGVCHAVALAVRPPVAGGFGRLSLGHSLRILSDHSPEAATVTDLVAGMQGLRASQSWISWSWRMPWGSTLRLQLASRAVRQRLAA